MQSSCTYAQVLSPEACVHADVQSVILLLGMSSCPAACGGDGVPWTAPYAFLKCPLMGHTSSLPLQILILGLGLGWACPAAWGVRKDSACWSSGKCSRCCYFSPALHGCCSFLPMQSFSLLSAQDRVPALVKRRQQGIKSVNRVKQRLTAVIGRIFSNFGVALSSGCSSLVSWGDLRVLMFL